MPRKLRVPKKREGVNSTARHVMSDGLYPEPEEPELLSLADELALEFPTTDSARARALWEASRAELLADWLEEYPGTRPSWWWIFDAPRMPAADVARYGWAECWFAAQLPDPRRRLGGIGTPRHEVLAYVPSFRCGIPDQWVTDSEARYYRGLAVNIHGEPIGQEFVGNDFAGVPIDPSNPPRFESQAAYLRRCGLLTPGEEAQLEPEDFEDEDIFGGSEPDEARTETLRR